MAVHRIFSVASAAAGPELQLEVVATASLLTRDGAMQNTRKPVLLRCLKEGSSFTNISAVWLLLSNCTAPPVFSLSVVI